LQEEHVQKNYDELEQMGMIKGATIHINYSSFGFKAVAYLLVNVESTQADELITYLMKMPEVYLAFRSSPKGTIDITMTIKTLQELEKTKALIRKKFSVSAIKTAIWTDIREMNQNLSVFSIKVANPGQESNNQMKNQGATSLSKKVIADKMDQEIADILAKNGRSTMEEIAKELGTTVETVKRKYKKLKEKGILKVTIQFDPSKIGYHALGIFFAVTSNVNPNLIINRISEIPDVISIMKTSGNYDLQIYAMIRDIEHLLSIQDELGKINGITKMDPEILRIPNTWPGPRQCISTF
jgi:Lrp/AsnC family transcriptional regulator, leucine-responsive regulatory protein